MDKIILLTLAVLYITLFVWSAVTVAKARKKVRLRIERASEVAQKINGDGRGYFCRYAPLNVIVDANGNEVSISDDENHKIIFCGLTPDSRIASRAYALCVEDGCFEHGLRGETLNTFQFFVCPKNALHRWIVQSVKENGILCTHSIMGNVYVGLDEQQLSVVRVGMVVMLEQCVKKIGKNYRLNYKYSGFLAR